MPTPEETIVSIEEATEIKNVEYKDEVKKSKKQKVVEEVDSDDEEEVDSDDDDEEEDSDDDDDEDAVEEEPLTDVTLYNVLGNFLIDDDGVSIGSSLSSIAKELGKLNHTLKKYSSKKD